MATYKVAQDVEAEDKLVGPFTLRQFIYLIIVVGSLWLTFILARNTFTLVFIPLPLVPALFFGLLVFLGVKNQSQPAESYLAALVRYYFKNHKRVWDQDGIIETVKVTAPPKIEHQYSDNLSRYEIRNRLGSLANIMDSRGWAAKGTTNPRIIYPTQSDDRLIEIGQIIAPAEPTDIHDRDDVMDETASPIAQHFDDMLQTQQQQYKQQAIAHMTDPSYSPYGDIRQKVIDPIGHNEEDAQNNPEAHRPNANQAKTENTQQADTGTPPNTSDPTSQRIKQLLDNSTDLSVQTIATEAQRMNDLESGQEVSVDIKHNS